MIHDVFIENDLTMSSTASSTSQCCQKVSGDGEDTHHSEDQYSEGRSTSKPETTSVVLEICFREQHAPEYEESKGYDANEDKSELASTDLVLDALELLR